MTEEWYYGRDEEHSGPVSTDELKTLANSGELLPTDLVWREGLEDWVAAKKIKDLFPKQELISTQTKLVPRKKDITYVTVSCSNCHARYRLDEQDVTNNRINCKVCNNRIVFHSETQSDQKIQFPLPDQIARCRELTENEVDIFRKILSAYAWEIPHHDIEEFGNAIAKIEGIFHPCFAIHFNTLFEQRQVVRQEQPYQGQTIPPLEVTAENADPWLCDFYHRTAFEEHQEESPIPNSQAVEDCADCGRSGGVTCPDCAGNGQVRCPACDGSTIVACPKCNGEGIYQEERQVPGEEKCYYCWGTGRFDGNKQLGIPPGRCQHCYGRGYNMGYKTEHYPVPCDVCRRKGKVLCSTCRATGAVVCSTCQGNTKVVCPRCEGHKQLLSNLVVERTFEPKSYLYYVQEGIKEETILQMLDNKIMQKDNLPTIEITEEKSIDSILTNLPHSSSVPAVADRISQLQRTVTDQTTTERRIVWNSVMVQQTVAARLRYRLEDAEYDAWLFGQDAELLPVRSPFSDVAETALESAITSWEQGEKSPAIEAYMRCRAMAAKDKFISQLLHDNSSRIPGGLKVAATTNSAIVSVKANLIRGATKISETFDAVKNSSFGKWFSKNQDKEDTDD